MKALFFAVIVTLLVAGSYAGRYLEIYSDVDCLELVAVDWCSECKSATDVDCESSGGGSSNYYSITYDYDFVYEDDIPSEFARVAYRSGGDCATMNATNVDFTAVNGSQIGECLGYFEGSQSAIRINGCDGTNPLSFQYYDISSTCNYNSPAGVFTSECGEIGSTGVFGLGSCPNDSLFGIPAAPTSNNTPANNAPSDSVPTNGPSTNPNANTPTSASGPASNNTPVKSSGAAQLAIGLLSVITVMIC